MILAGIAVEVVIVAEVVGVHVEGVLVALGDDLHPAVAQGAVKRRELRIGDLDVL